MTSVDQDDAWVSVTKLTKDLRQAAVTMGQDEVRFLVDDYYAMQRARIRAAGQVRSMQAEPHETLAFLTDQTDRLEGYMKLALQAYVEAQPIGRWLMGIVGIGPVISAGLLAHIDIAKCPTVGHIWAFAGFDPTRKWLPKTKRPYNATFKMLCAYKAGESFVKNSNRPGCFYGQLYKTRKEQEILKNNAGGFAVQAQQALANKNFDKKTDAYKAYVSGKLPPAHIHARARRYAVKLFLAHLHEEMYVRHYGKAPPLPYPIAHMGHVHKVENPSPSDEVLDILTNPTTGVADDRP